RDSFTGTAEETKLATDLIIPADNTEPGVPRPRRLKENLGDGPDLRRAVGRPHFTARRQPKTHRLELLLGDLDGRLEIHVNLHQILGSDGVDTVDGPPKPAPEEMPFNAHVHLEFVGFEDSAHGKR